MLQILFGAPGSGKTAALMRSIREGVGPTNHTNDRTVKHGAVFILSGNCTSVGVMIQYRK